MQSLRFGKRIRQLRIQKGMTQRDLSARLGIDFTYLSKIENNKAEPPSDEVIKGLARELNTDPEELFTLAAKVSQSDVRNAVAADSRIGVLLRKLQSRGLTSEQIDEMLRIASRESRDDASDH